MNELITPEIHCEKQRIDAFFDEFCLHQTEFADLLEKHDIDEETLLPFTNWSSDTYQRICLNRNENCELILLCWNIGQGTKIHDHNGEKCWVNVVKGTFTEELYSNDLPKKLVKTHELEPGSSTFLTDDIASHRLMNLSGEKAISLHMYSNPIDKCQVFQANSDEANMRYMKYDFDFREVKCR